MAWWAAVSGSAMLWGSLLRCEEVAWEGVFLLPDVEHVLPKSGACEWRALALPLNGSSLELVILLACARDHLRLAFARRADGEAEDIEGPRLDAHPAEQVRPDEHEAAPDRSAEVGARLVRVPV